MRLVLSDPCDSVICPLFKMVQGPTKLHRSAALITCHCGTVVDIAPASHACVQLWWLLRSAKPVTELLPKACSVSWICECVSCGVLLSKGAPCEHQFFECTASRDSPNPWLFFQPLIVCFEPLPSCPRLRTSELAASAYSDIER